jgi:ATP-binding cassette subfamily F protein 3
VFLDALKKFSGTVIFVSHDRAFMEALSTRTLELRASPPETPPAGGHRLFYGNYAYYLERLEREAAGGNAAGTMASAALGTDPSISAPLPVTIPIKAALSPVLSAAEQREALKQKQALIRRLERREQEILAELDALEAEKAALETELGKPEVYSSGEKARAVKAGLDAAALAIEGKSREWDAAAEELGRLKGNV